MKLREKWQDPLVHPANTGPKMSQAELKELAADIKKYGLQEPIVYWQDNREAANGSEGPFPLYLLDGVNRLAALHLLGIKDPRSAPQGSVVAFTTRTLRAIKAVSYLGGKSGWETDTDPYALHLSLNAVRRHLTPAQKRWMIRQAIARKPEANDSEIARDTKSARKSVRLVRAEIVNSGTRFSTNDHLPIERAKKVLRDNPNLSERKVAKLAKVSKKSNGTPSRRRKRRGSTRPSKSRTSSRSFSQSLRASSTSISPQSQRGCALTS